ncbi:MAG: sodium:proton antiporter [Gammaproteobacteria bacterium RIFCSPLOWO2_02_FULL_56_15]|nr:MAG: sodium:proton antiporter [Gammaproteobacteria bacterium RIFCSPLOWO2_02_FULL_56_15]
MTFGNSIFLIFTGAALLATLALFARQAMIVAYIVLGVIAGPWGLGYVDDPEVIGEISDIGIIFLLYLLGLDLFPQQLWKMLGEAATATLVSSLLFWTIGFVTGWLFGLETAESVLIGAALMFSSTIIGVKLLPTTILHHRHTGQIIISVLLLQDLIAILVLLLLQGYGKGGHLVLDILLQLGSLPVLIVAAWLLERYVLVRLINRFDQIHEYIFLLAIAWCLGVSQLADLLGLSHEIGAFIAGVTLASSPIAMFITDRLKPLRDFFLVIFFFALGAGFDMGLVLELILPAGVLAILVIVIKPLVFAALFVRAGEKRDISIEVGFRLGQISEFSMLIAVLAVDSGFISSRTSSLAQLAALLTFIVSSYIIVLFYPTPIAVSDRLRRD